MVPQGRGETGWSPARASAMTYLSSQLLTHEFWGNNSASWSLPATTKESKAEPMATTLISA